MDLLLILLPLGPPSCAPECDQKEVRQKSTYSDRHGPSGKFVENYIKPTCLEVTSYPIKYSTVLWLLDLQIRRGIKA